jgi:hypothetical protein
VPSLGHAKDNPQEEKKESDKRKMKKMIMASTILLAALMAVGLSYSLWYKILYINGTVYTGTLDAKFEGPFAWSATWNDSGVITVVPPEKLQYITVNVAPSALDDQILLVNITGLYPCITIHITYNITNDGTIPWKVNSTKTSADPEPFPGTVNLSGIVFGTQVDPGQHIVGDVEIHLTNDALQNADYYFSFQIVVVQWNEYPGYLPTD